METSSDIYWETDAEHRLTDRHAGKRGGPVDPFPLDESIGRRRWEYPGVVGNDPVWRKHKACLEARRAIRDFEYVRMGTDGIARHLLINGDPVFGAQGEFLGYRGVASDVTENRFADRLQRMEHEVIQALSDAATLHQGVKSALEALCRANHWKCGRLYRLDAVAGVMRFQQAVVAPGEDYDKLVTPGVDLVFRRSEGLVGLVWQSGVPLWIEDIAGDPRVANPLIAGEMCLRSALLFPVSAGAASLGVISISSDVLRKPERRLQDMMTSIGAQIAQFLQRKEAEAMWRDNEARFRDLTALSADWYWEQDSEFRFVRFTGAENAGVWSAQLPEARAIGLRRWELPGIGTVSSSWEDHRKLLAAREPFRNFEYRRTHEDGKTTFFSVSGQPVHDSEGRFQGYRGVATDITARKRDEQLRELEHAVARVLSAGAQPAPTLDAVMQEICHRVGMESARYFEVDERGEHLCFSRGWAASNEASARFVEASQGIRFRAGEGLAGRVWQSGEPLWVADVSQDKRASNRGLARTAGVHSAFVVPVRSQSRTIGVLSFSGQRMREPDERLLLAVRPIGTQLGQYLERQRAEARLRESNERFEVVARATSDIVWDWNFESGEAWWNDNYYSVLGYRRDGAGTAIDTWKNGIHPDDVERVVRGAQEAIDSGAETWSDEYRFRRADGSHIDVFDRGLLIKDAAGKPVRMIGAMVDVTERRSSERAALLHASRQEAIAAFGQFAVKRRSGDEIASQAVRVLADKADAALLLERRADGDVVLIAGAGSGAEALIGNSTPLSPGSAAHHVFSGAGPVLMSEDYLQSRPTGLAWSNWVRTMRSAAFAPVTRNGHIHGVLAIYSARAEAFTDLDIRFAESIGHVLSAALQREEAQRLGEVRIAFQQRIGQFSEFALARHTPEVLTRKALAILAEDGVVAALFEPAEAGRIWLRDAQGEDALRGIGESTELLPASAAQRVLDGAASVTLSAQYFQSIPEIWPWSSWMRRMRSGAFVAVTNGGHTSGMLALCSGNEAGIGGDEVRFAESIGHILSTALQRERAERLVSKHARRQELIAELGRRALGESDMQGLFTESVRIALDEQAGAVAVFERDSAKPDCFRLRAAHGIESSAIVGSSLQVCSNCPVGVTFDAGKPLLVRDHHSKPCARVHGGWGKEMRSSVNVRIAGEQGDFGVLSVFARAADAFDQNDVRHVQSVANVLSSAVQRIQAEQRLAYLAQYDTLTGLANRSLLEESLKHAMAQARRRFGQGAVLFIDLDGFKLVNDTLGHAVGDALLREVAIRLRNCVRADDNVGRISGDEFGILLADLAAADDAALVAQKVLDALAMPFAADGGETFLTASIGISSFPADGEDPGTVLRNADLAMYQGKEAGRNTYRYFKSEMTERSVARLKLHTDVRQALERREFALHYQPKVDLATRSLTGVEALMRWRHPQRGMVSPAEFIPALENSGLILQAGEWALEEVCAQIRAWQAAGLQPVPVAINLSARQFRRPRLDRIVQETLARAGIAAELIELEITESGIADDPEDAIRQLQSLRAAGHKISIDDFGTGYSSLAYLTRMPLSVLKIDRSFVSRMLEDPKVSTLVQTMISLARSLSLAVVAEGVETEAQATFLRLLRCDQMQGYLFSKPLPPEALAQLLVRCSPALA